MNECRLIFTNSNHEDVGLLMGAEGTMAYGSSENKMTFSMPSSSIPAGLGNKSHVYIEGSEWGGRISSVSSNSDDGTVEFSGPTWHGLLACRIIVPPSGKDYLTADGDANRCLAALVDACGLGSIFSVDASDSGIDISGYRYERFVDAYTGAMDMLSSSSARLRIVSTSPKPVLKAEKIIDYSSDEYNSKDVGIDAKRDFMCVNHLICAGTGEGKNRIVVHLYADRDGNVSREQTIFGEDVCEAFYDYPNAGEDELEKQGTKRLKEYQNEPSGSLHTLGEIKYAVGDIVGRFDPITGIESVGIVSKAILRFSDGIDESFEVGKPVSRTGFSVSAETSGGVSYAAGDGIDITGNTISADVTQAKLDSVSSLADSASKAAATASVSASNAAAAAEKAQQTADAKAPSVHSHSASDITSGTLSADRLPDVPADKLSGVIPSTNLPAYVDDVIEGTISTFPKPGEAGKIYTDTQTNRTYRWGGSSYVEISASIALGETSATAYRGDRGKAAYDHSTSKGNPHGTTLSNLGVTATAAELNYMGGVTSGVQEQLDGKSTKVHMHSASDISSGTLPISRGGTGATTAKAAEYAIHGTPAASTSEVSDASPLVFVYANPSASQGTFFMRKASALWSYIKGKSDAIYAKASHTHLYAGSNETGGAATTALACTGNAASATKLAAKRTIKLTGAVKGSAVFDGSSDVTITTTGDSEAAGFLDAHPVGSFFETSVKDNPSIKYGGEWTELPSLGGYKFMRTK